MPANGPREASARPATTTITRDLSYGAAWMRQAVEDRVVAESANANPRQELLNYLSSPLDFKCTDLIGWWKYHRTEYPTLARLARDYLSIPGSAVASERSFSSSRHIGTDFRNSLGTDTFEAVQIVKAGYKAGLISAADEVFAMGPGIPFEVQKRDGTRVVSCP